MRGSSPSPASSTCVMMSHGAPRITGAMLDAAPRLRFVGELEGDRFARRIDVDAAARAA